MNALSRVLVFKITATVLVWCVPMLLVPSSMLVEFGFPAGSSDLMFVRLLGWAYLALCVGYAFGLKSSLNGFRALGPIWVGIVSNGGACVLLFFYGMSGAWVDMSPLVQFIFWSSTAATAGITGGLWVWGVQGKQPVA
jgi:hypothetical protein